MTISFLITKSLLCLCYFIGSEGSVILLEAFPDNFIDGLTQTVRLRCSVNDTAASSGVIGRRNLGIKDVNNNDDIIYHDVVDIPYNVEEVLSIIITRNGSDVAAITHAHSPNVLDGSSNMQVNGHLEIFEGQGFIELIWEYPTSEQLKNFGCQANSINQVGHSVTFSQDISFLVTQPSITDLVAHIQTNAKTNKEATNTIKDLEASISGLKAEKQAMQSDIAQLQTTANHLETENDAMKAIIDHIGHIETGRVAEFHGVHWAGSGTRYTDVQQAFKKPYDKAPNVTLGTVRLDAAGTIRFDASLQQVDTTGFTVRLETWADTHLTSWYLDWISVPV